MVEKPLDPYLDPNIVDRSPFYKFRGTMISFYEATKKYYSSLITGIEEDTG
jgi:ACT domain-containing protein